jgi:putative tryptophan/tyrosine transport system substrate-binding protein
MTHLGMGQMAIGRRQFISALGGAGFAWPLRASAQHSERIRHIGVFLTLAEDDPEAKARIATFDRELNKLGWSEGRQVNIDVRFAAGHPDKFPMLAKEFVESKPDVIVAYSSLVTAALQRETRAIPIVFVNVSDPIGQGFVSSLARPSANLTGVLQYETGIVGKWLGLLKEIAPKIIRVAILGNPKTGPYEYFLKAAEVAAPSLTIELVPTRIETAADIERSIESFAYTPNGGLLIPPDATTIGNRDLIVALTARHHLPAVYPFRLFVVAGGLMAYETPQDEMFGQTASYVDRILRGANPAELPVQAPTRFETVINLKTAKALGLDVPPSLLVRADEVIE